MQVYIAGHREVEQLLPMAECIEVMAATLRALAEGKALQPLRTVVAQPDGRGMLGLIPAYVENPQAIGSKVITVFPGNRGTRYESHQGSVLLFESEHGRLLAMVDAGAVTAIRTAAVSAVATRVLAREGASELAILGSGTQASQHLTAMRAVRPISRVRVWSRTPEHAQRFAARESELHGIEVTPVTSAHEAVEGADIICTVTLATSPILEGAWLAPGTHINAVGSSVPPFRELDSATVVDSQVYVDRRESALSEAEDIRVPIREGRIDEGHIRGELGELLAGRVSGRTGQDEVTLFKSLGLAVEDLAAAHHVYRAGKGRDIGTWVEFSGMREG